MFKNITLYRITAGLPFDEHTNAGLQQDYDFVPCSATQEKSVGWVPPRGHENGALLESVAGQWILKLMVESKTLPADVVKRKVAEEVAKIEVSTGRKPGKKERREISEDARLSLLPMAFTKQVATLVWIDPTTNLLAIDSASQGKLDEVISALVTNIYGLSLQMIQTVISPSSAMAQWLIEKEGPYSFTVDRECELKACDESKAVVKYGRHPLDIDEVAQHIAQGKIPTRLALTYDDRVSFVLADAGSLKKIALLDCTVDCGMTLENDAFDADVAITTGELKKLIPELLGALGGELAAIQP